MNLLVRGRAEHRHSSGCVYADQWSFGTHIGMKLQLQENGTDFVANPNPWG